VWPIGAQSVHLHAPATRGQDPASAGRETTVRSGNSKDFYPERTVVLVSYGGQPAPSVGSRRDIAVNGIITDAAVSAAMAATSPAAAQDP
jgi:hypothetical protein